MQSTESSYLNYSEEQHIEQLPEVDRPFIPKGTHPVETGHYLIPTNMIFRLYKEVVKWIDNRTPGAIFYGRPRIGKTKAIAYIKKLLPEDFGLDLPVFHVLSMQCNTISEDRFFAHMLEQVGHQLYISGNMFAKRDRLIKYLISKGEMSDNKRLVMFIDDAQRLCEKEYEWLMDIYNQLDKYGISMSVILVGQEDLVHQRSAFHQSKKAQIIGRFMIHDYQFSGTNDINDIRNCLIGYDTGSEYPKGSGWSFTRYFFPEAYALGYRLEHYAENIYKIFENVRKESNIIKNYDIPMQYLVLTIEYVMKNFGANGQNLQWVTDTNWKEAIEYSGYIRSEHFQENYKEVN